MSNKWGLMQPGTKDVSHPDLVAMLDGAEAESKFGKRAGTIRNEHGALIVHWDDGGSEPFAQCFETTYFRTAGNQSQGVSEGEAMLFLAEGVARAKAKREAAVATRKADLQAAAQGRLPPSALERKSEIRGFNDRPAYTTEAEKDARRKQLGNIAATVCGKPVDADPEQVSRVDRLRAIGRSVSGGHG